MGFRENQQDIVSQVGSNGFVTVFAPKQQTETSTVEDDALTKARAMIAAGVTKIEFLARGDKHVPLDNYINQLLSAIQRLRQEYPQVKYGVGTVSYTYDSNGKPIDTTTRMKRIASVADFVVTAHAPDDAMIGAAKAAGTPFFSTVSKSTRLEFANNGATVGPNDNPGSGTDELNPAQIAHLRDQFGIDTIKIYHFGKIAEKRAGKKLGAKEQAIYGLIAIGEAIQASYACPVPPQKTFCAMTTGGITMEEENLARVLAGARNPEVEADIRAILGTRADPIINILKRTTIAAGGTFVTKTYDEKYAADPQAALADLTKTCKEAVETARLASGPNAVIRKSEAPATVWMIGEPMVEQDTQNPNHHKVSGTVANAAVAAAEFGKLAKGVFGANTRPVKVEIAGALGTQGESAARAKQIRDFLSSRGVGTSYLADDAQHPTAIVKIKPKGSDPRFDFVDRDDSAANHYFERDKNGRLAADDIPFRKGDYVIIDLIAISRCRTPEARTNMLATVQRAKAAGANIVMDINYRPNLWWKTPGNKEEAKTRAMEAFKTFLPTADILCPGAPEDLDLFGCSKQQAFDQLSAMIPEGLPRFSYMILKEGEEGSQVIPRKGKPYRIPCLTHPDPQIQARPEETSGLGDSFLGAFCATLGTRGIIRPDSFNKEGHREVVLAAACGSQMAAANVRSVGGAIDKDIVPSADAFNPAAQKVLGDNGLDTSLAVTAGIKKN